MDAALRDGNGLASGQEHLGARTTFVLLVYTPLGQVPYGVGDSPVIAVRIEGTLAVANVGLVAAFVDDGGLLLGICNGFQTLTKMGLLPRLDGAVAQTVTVTTNDRGRFHDGWVRLKGDPASPCVFTRGVDFLEAPVRHGEGKVVAREPDLLDRLAERGMVPVRYVDEEGRPTEEFPHNPNGSPGGIAGLCDETGRIFGLMPHPEAYHSPFLHPHWPRQQRAGLLPAEGPGLVVFRNARDWLLEHA